MIKNIGTKEFPYPFSQSIISAASFEGIFLDNSYLKFEGDIINYRQFIRISARSSELVISQVSRSGTIGRPWWNIEDLWGSKLVLPSSSGTVHGHWYASDVTISSLVGMVELESSKIRNCRCNIIISNGGDSDYTGCTGRIINENGINLLGT